MPRDIKYPISVVDKFTGPIGKMAKAITAMGGKLKNLQKTGDTISFHAVGQSAAVLAQGMSQSFNETKQIFANFEHQMVTVRSVLGDIGNEDFQTLSKKAKQLGASTIFTASQTGEAMENLARAGSKPKQILEQIGPILKLATAENTDLAFTSDLVVSSLNQFELSADRAGNVAEKLAAASSSAAIDLSTIKETMKEGGVSAASFGASLSETLAFTGVLGNVGIKGSKAGTGMKSFFSAITNTAKIKKLESLGIAVKDISGNTLPVQQILSNMSKALSKVEDKGTKLGIVGDIFGDIGKSAASTLTKDFPKVVELFSKIENSTGALDSKFKQLSETQKGLKATMNSAKQAFQQSMGEAFMPMENRILSLQTKFFVMATSASQNFPTVSAAMMGVVGAGGFLADNISTLSHLSVLLSSSLGATTFKLIAQTAKMAIMLPVQAAVIAGKKLWTSVQWALNVAMSANPIGLIIAGVAALGAAIYTIYKNWDSIVGAFKSGYNTISSIIGTVGSFLGFGGRNKKTAQEPARANVSRSEITKNNKSTVDINVKAPKGSTATQSNATDGVNVSLGGAKL